MRGDGRASPWSYGGDAVRPGVANTQPVQCGSRRRRTMRRRDLTRWLPSPGGREERARTSADVKDTINEKGTLSSLLHQGKMTPCHMKLVSSE